MSDQQRPYHNESSQAQRKEVLNNDKAQHSTYLSRAAGSIGEELGGRFAALARGQQQVVGTAPSPYPRQPSYWAEADNAVEPPLNVDVNAMEPIGGPPEVVPELPKTVEVEVLTAKGFRRRV
jgi:hypothetical protein